MATSLSGNATIAGIWNLGVPIVLRSLKVMNDGTAEAAQAKFVEVRDGDNVTMRAQIRYGGVLNEDHQDTFPGQGVHCSGISVFVPAGPIHVVWQISYDNP